MLSSTTIVLGRRVLGCARYATRFNPDILPPKYDAHRSDRWVDPKQYQGEALGRTLERLSDDNFSSFLLTPTTSTLFAQHFKSSQPEARSQFLSTYVQHLESRTRRLTRGQLIVAAAGLDQVGASDLAPFILQTRLESEVFPQIADEEHQKTLEKEVSNLLSSGAPSTEVESSEWLDQFLPSNLSDIAAAEFAKDAHISSEETEEVLKLSKLLNNNDTSSLIQSLRSNLPDGFETNLDNWGSKPTLDPSFNLGDELVQDTLGKRLQDSMNTPKISEKDKHEILAEAVTFTSIADRPRRRLLERFANDSVNVLDINQFVAEQCEHGGIEFEHLEEMTQLGQSIHQLLNNPHVNNLHHPVATHEELSREFSRERALQEIQDISQFTAMDAKELSSHLLGLSLDDLPSDAYFQTYATVAAERVAEFDSEDISLLLAGLEHVDYQPPSWIIDILASKAGEHVIQAQRQATEQ